VGLSATAELLVEIRERTDRHYRSLHFGGKVIREKLRKDLDETVLSFVSVQQFVI